MRTNVEAFLPSLTTFAKAADREGLDGYIIAPGTPAEADGITGLGRWLRCLLHTIADCDQPRRWDPFQQIDDPGWQFSFLGVRMFISVFSTLYPKNHPRYSPTGVHIFCQPETLFDAHHIGSAHPSSESTKQAIRRQFAEAGYDYPGAIIDERIEARLYLMPRWHDDAETMWWKAPAEG